MASLSERVAAAKAATSTTFDSQREDMFKQLRGKLHFKIVEELGPTLYDRQMSDAELRLRVLEMLEWALDQEDGVPLTRADRTQLLNEIASDVLGYGPMESLSQRSRRHRGHGQRTKQGLRGAFRQDRTS